MMSYKSVSLSKEARHRDSWTLSGASLRDILFAPENFQAPAPDEPLGLGRSLFSAFSIILALFMCYVSLHYIPAHFRTDGVVGLTNENGRLIQQYESQSSIPVIGDYLDAFNVRRTYLKNGQTLEARYTIPEGSTLQLRVRQCRSIFGIEVFHCYIRAEDSITITTQTDGRQTLTAYRDGFYHFDDFIVTPEGGQKFQIVWSRR